MKSQSQIAEPSHTCDGDEFASLRRHALEVLLVVLIRHIWDLVRAHINKTTISRAFGAMYLWVEVQAMQWNVCGAERSESYNCLVNRDICKVRNVCKVCCTT